MRAVRPRDAPWKPDHVGDAWWEMNGPMAEGEYV